MKKLLALFFLALFLKPCLGQYTVTKVNGSVHNNSSGEKLKLGSKLSDDDVLQFSSPNDMVRVIVAGKGIYIISPSSKAEKKPNAIVEMLKSALHVKSKEGYLSGRAEEIEFLPGALETEPTINTFNLFTQENKYIFDKKKYEISNGNRFFLQIETSGSKPLIQPLTTRKDTLVVLAADFKMDNKDPDRKVKYSLGFYTKEKKTSESLIEINPHIDHSGEMETIIKAVIAGSSISDKSKLQQECYEEVYQALGRPSDIIFKHVFNNLYADFPRHTH